MREIKFRAWDDKQMDYDYRDASLWHGLLVAEGDTIFMQYTGLHDKHGREVYESDICTVDRGMMYSGAAKTMVEGKYQVYWNEDRWGLKDTNDDDYDNGDYYHGDLISWNTVTVIGNIYDQ